MKKNIAKLLLFIIALFLPCLVIADTTSYSCKFSIVASPKGLNKETLNLQYVLDSKTKKAYTIGNMSSSEVEFIRNIDGISFIEITESGNVMVTAISSAGDSVHSRNGILLGKVIPSQFYGNCTQK